jgi:proteasome lid subunit RPN8/RPN11
MSKVGLLLAIDNEVTRCIRQHARSHMTTEVCGVLIGDKRNGVVEVRASIEASNAAQGGTHVTFTQDAWETIYRVKDESYPDQRMIGWYHSHPGFGVFLSEHDLFIQRNFFSSPDQVAWVYDPHTDEEGCFGWIDGEIHRISTFSIVDNNGDGVERTPKEMEAAPPEAAESRTAGVHRPAWIRWSTIALKYLSAMVLGFAIAYFLFPRFYLVAINPLTGEPMLVQPQGPSPQPAKASPDPNAGRSK